MPYKVKRPCLYPGCVNTVTSGYCEAHAHFQTPLKDLRPSSASRGYGTEWRAIRARVLRDAGIPKELRPLYDVHHAPPYDPKIDPDHRNYTLTPLLHGDHSRETGRSKGRRIKSPEVKAGTVKVPQGFSQAKRGVKNG